MPRDMRSHHIRFVEAQPATSTVKFEKYKLRQRILKEFGREGEQR